MHNFIFQLLATPFNKTLTVDPKNLNLICREKTVAIRLRNRRWKILVTHHKCEIIPGKLVDSAVKKNDHPTPIAFGKAQ